MSQTNNDTFNPFDPAGLFKGMRDSGVESWSKTMIELVNTETFARAMGTTLDAWLATSGPLHKAIENAMTRVLTGLNMPTRADVTALAERLTNIELRLDDLEAKLEEGRRAANGTGAGHAPGRRRGGRGHEAGPGTGENQ